MMARTFQLPPIVEAKLRAYFEQNGHSFDRAERLAASIKSLSDYFTTREGSATPWEQSLAYMAYFFPLNVVRLSAVLEESFRDFPWANVDQIIDFGSGPGTTHVALEASTLAPKPILNIEVDAKAVQIHKSLKWERWSASWSEQLLRSIAPRSLGVFCYSLLEAPHVLQRLPEFEHVLIVAPSTRTQGRDLLEIRAELTSAGYHSWAPCTHSLACPLLTHSKTDWCHDRIAFSSPAWYQKLESHLPLYNHTLTFSYWFASRTEMPKRSPNAARAIGDTLFEKGKIRQMLCRGSEREFLAWLTKHGEPESIPRGSLIELAPNIQKKGNELRPV